jgi:hypothetical protein
MQSRETRFVLRIESGERQGEQVPLADGTLQVGRRPECGLVLKDGSVSGKHAELRVNAGRVELADLGSTNGTRVSGQKIEQTLVGHGDAILFGNVRVTLHDVRLAGDAPPIDGLPEEPRAATASASAPAASAAGGGALGKVSADKLDRSRKSSKSFGILLVLLLLLGGGAFAYLKFLRPGGSAGARVEVPAVPGNRIADGSFEEGTAEWSVAEAATAGFFPERGFARSGATGLGVMLESADAWSLVRSPEFPLPPRRSLAVSAALRVDDDARGRVGVELSSSTAAAPAFVAWAPARPAGDFAEQELDFVVLGGYDRGRVVAAATGPGAAALDDVVALEREPLGNATRFAEYELAVLGDPGSTAMLVRSGRVLLGGFDLSAWNREGLTGWPTAVMAARAGEQGFQLTFPGAPEDARLRFFAVRAEQGPTGAGGSGGWAATTGDDGYAAHTDDFTRAGVTGLLLGSGTELVRIGFARPVEITARGADGSVAFSVALGGLQECGLQLAFGPERAEASALADRAADAERKKDLGAALAAWSELLDRFPFERQLVARASEARGRLVQAGLDQVDELRRDLEQARFFLLPELFAEGEQRALQLADQYRGSAVESEARGVAQECARARTELSAGDRSGAAERLRGVLGTLDPDRAPRLRAHVEQALQTVDPGAERD